MINRNVLVSPFRDTVYSAAELLGSFETNAPRSYERTLDFRVYAHFVKAGRIRKAEYMESVIQSLHDNSITHATNDWLDAKRVVAFMGGHDLERGVAAYVSVIRMAKTFAESGFAVVSGGGPGAMEAAHLGPFLAGASEDAVVQAIDHLKAVPKLPGNLMNIVDPQGVVDYTVLEALHQWQVPAMELYSAQHAAAHSLAIPTWHYGHEPPTPFATHIAKYFQNSIREDGLVSVGTHGIIFVEGKAGTLQEIYQDAAQNYYKSFGWFSPMVFFGVDYWTSKLPVKGTLQNLFAPADFANLVLFTDDVGEAVAFITRFQPPGTRSKFLR